MDVKSRAETFQGLVSLRKMRGKFIKITAFWTVYFQPVRSLPGDLSIFSYRTLSQAYGFISDYAHLRFEDKEVHLPKYLLLFNIKLTTNQLTWPRSRAGTRQSQSSFQLVHCSHVGWPFNPGNKPGGRKRPCPFSFRWPWCSSFASKVV